MTLDEIKQAIASLPPDELAKLRAWLEQFEVLAPGQTTSEPETTASKWGRLAGRAVADVRKRFQEK